MVRGLDPGCCARRSISSRSHDRSAPRPALSDGSVVHAGAVRLGSCRRQPRCVGDPRWGHVRDIDSAACGYPAVGTRGGGGVSRPRWRALQQPFRWGGVCGAVRASSLGDADAAGCFLTVDPPRPGWPTRRRGSPYRLPSNLTGAQSWHWTVSGTEEGREYRDGWRKLTTARGVVETRPRAKGAPPGPYRNSISPAHTIKASRRRLSRPNPAQTGPMNVSADRTGAGRPRVASTRTHTYRRTGTSYQCELRCSTT